MLKIKSPAKLNLVLEVLRRRPDGYHEVRTVMQSIDLCDSITIEEHPTVGHIELHTDMMACPVDERNLVWQAVHWLRDATGFDVGLAITIEKRIPIGGGLGGGSSNAGTVLLALVGQYGLDISRADLNRIAGRIGSDVAFFLVGGTALSTGRGEIVEEVPELPRTAFVLANPGVFVKTGQVYASLNLGKRKGEHRSAGAASERFLSQLSEPIRWELMHNDLQPAARRLFPRVDEVFEVFSALDVKHAMLSGSGATVFAPVESLDDGNELVIRLQTAGFWAASCESMDRSQFHRCIFPNSNGTAAASGRDR